jgi:hypothetical protein
MNELRHGLPLSPGDAALRATVRAALDAAEPAQAPAFAALWQRAATAAADPRTRSTRSAPLHWSYAIAAGVAAIALGVVLGRPDGAHAPATLADQADVAADLQLALALAAREPWRVHSDALLDMSPAPMTRGAPALPAVRYPLLPEEKYL